MTTEKDNADRPCFQRSHGERMTGAQRLELLARHWAEHVRDLQAAAAKS